MSKREVYKAVSFFLMGGVLGYILAKIIFN